MFKSVVIFVVLIFRCLDLYSQKEAKIWYFADKAGLDFNTTPPTVLTNGSMSAVEGCATISDGPGSLLFYTDGITIWDKTHAIMANGTGFTGNISTTQSALIVKQPGSSTIYYVFSLGAMGTGSLCCSIVDMSLAAGNGSVIVKNTLLATAMTEKLTAVMHCNKNDVWVMSHDNNSNNFRCYLVTSAGVNMNPVISSYGTIYAGNFPWGIGSAKFSPNGKKLGMTLYGVGNDPDAFEVYDFDNATGVVSNSLVLSSSLGPAYGLEFSPDGSKVYGTCETAAKGFYQWDLCAGSNAAIVASQYFQMTPVTLEGMQVATDGKIYISKQNQTDLAVINNPNSSGAACSFNYTGQTIAPKLSRFALPNFICSFFESSIQPQPFMFSVNCAVVSYSSPTTFSMWTAGCGAAGYSATGMLWDFGDPSTLAANNSAFGNPSHTYSAPGSYTTQLIIYYPCSTDTIRLPVIIPPSITLSVSGTFNVCKGDKSVYTVSGANTYTWSNNLNTPTVSLSPTVTTTYSVAGSGTVTGCSPVKLFTVTVSKCTGIEGNNGPLNDLKIYPNPVKDIVKIEIPSTINVSIMNIMGKILLTETFDEGLQEMDVSSLDTGIYILKASNENGSTRTVRFIKSEEN